MTKMYVVKMRDYDLNEDRTQIVIERNGKRYEDCLFFQPIGKQRICKTYKAIDIAEPTERDEVLAVFREYLNLCDEFELKYFASTLSSMMHWAFMNGFTNYMFKTWDKDEVNKVAEEIGRPDQMIVKEIIV